MLCKYLLYCIAQGTVTKKKVGSVKTQYKKNILDLLFVESEDVGVMGCFIPWKTWSCQQE